MWKVTEVNMDKESVVKEIISQFIEFAPDFKRFFMTVGHNEGRSDVPKLTSLQYMAVLALGVAGTEPMTMNALSNLLNISKQQTTKLVDGLVEEKLVERYTNPDNRREVLAELSLTGFDCLAKIRQSKFKSLLAFLSDYSEEEMNEILGHVRALNAVFRRKAEGDKKCGNK